MQALLTATVVALAVLGAGCASNGVQAQWTDPGFAGRSLSGERVLVVCDAAEATLKQICEDQIAARLAASGVAPVRGSGSHLGAPGMGAANESALAAARDVGAKAIFATTVAPDATVVNPGPTVGIGMGSFGGYGGGIGGGVGVSVPVGANRVSTAYGANMALTDVATGKLMWSSKVTASASQDVSAQMGKLAEAGIAAVQKAGML